MKRFYVQRCTSQMHEKSEIIFHHCACVCAHMNGDNNHKHVTYIISAVLRRRKYWFKSWVVAFFSLNCFPQRADAAFSFSCSYQRVREQDAVGSADMRGSGGSAGESQTSWVCVCVCLWACVCVCLWAGAFNPTGLPRDTAAADAHSTRRSD